MGGGRDLGLSQEKGVGKLSESCISQKMRLEVKLETAVNSISEKNSRACFVFFPLVLQKSHNLLCRGKGLQGERNGNVVKYGLLKDRKNCSI